MGRRAMWLAGFGALGLTGGCATQSVVVPSAHLPPARRGFDAQASAALSAPTPTSVAAAKAASDAAALGAPKPDGAPKGKDAAPEKGDAALRRAFELTAGLPGAGAQAPKVPLFDKASPGAENLKVVEALFPRPAPLPAPVADDSGLSLGELTQIALANNPAIAQASATADAAYGTVIQQGLYPNPTVGYEADQITPTLRQPAHGRTGQQGAFFNILIRTAGKVRLGQQVAAYDYVNALLGVRRAEVNVRTGVRQAYFNALVAKQGVEVNRILAGLADQVYQLQLKRIAGGFAAAYEAFPFLAQSEQLRNEVVRAEAAYRASLRQLNLALAAPNNPVTAVAGRADAAIPALDFDSLQARVIAEHTDILSARNSVAQEQVNLVLQRRIPIPDATVNLVQQYDTLANLYQYNLQLGLQLPVLDANQGNIRASQSRIRANIAQVGVQQITLSSQLAEAYGRYEANRRVATNLRDLVLPNLARTYSGVVAAYQAGAGPNDTPLNFNDIVNAQGNYATALQAYVAALQAAWQSVVDLGNVAQLDELYPDADGTTPPVAATAPRPLELSDPAAAPAPRVPAPLPPPRPAEKLP